jgi:hypothetical protein
MTNDVNILLEILHVIVPACTDLHECQKEQI